MDFKSAKCPNCAGDLKIPHNGTIVKCQYCGGDIILKPDSIEAINSPLNEGQFIQFPSLDELKNDINAIFVELDRGDLSIHLTRKPSILAIGGELLGSFSRLTTGEPPEFAGFGCFYKSIEGNSAYYDFAGELPFYAGINKSSSSGLKGNGFICLSGKEKHHSIIEIKSNLRDFSQILIYASHRDGYENKVELKYPGGHIVSLLSPPLDNHKICSVAVLYIRENKLIIRKNLSYFKAFEDMFRDLNMMDFMNVKFTECFKRA